MYKIKKRFVSILLVIAMVMGLFVAWPMTALAVDRYVESAIQLNDALIAVNNGDTIILTDNINNFPSFILASRNFTIDLNGYTLSINPIVDYSAIEVIMNTNLTIKGPGILNATNISKSAIWVFGGKLINNGAIINAISNSTVSEVCGVHVAGGGEATVSNVTAADIGVRAEGANNKVNKVTVTGSVSATRRGVWVENGGEAAVEGSVTVTGASNNATGVYVDGVGSKATVKGNVSANGEGNTGVFVRGTRSSATVNGSVSANRVGVNAQSGATATVGNITLTAAGNGVNVTGSGSSVAVNGNINAPGVDGRGVYINGTSSVTVTGSVSVTSTGVNVQGGGSATVGSVSNTAVDSYCVNVIGTECSVKVNGNVSATGTGSRGVYVRGIRSSATVNGSVRACRTGVDVQDGATATVGNVTATDANGSGVRVVNSGSSVTVNGNVSTTGVDSIGVYIREANSRATVTGSVSATGTGVRALDGGKATVGSVTVTGTNCDGVYAGGAGSGVTVNGNVSATGVDSSGVYVGVYAGVASSSVTVNGNVSTTGVNSTGVYVSGANSSATVTGSVNAPYVGVYAYNGGKAITGSVVSNNIGAIATTGSNIIIDGTITVPSSGVYIYIENTLKTSSDFKTPTTKAGYRTYTDGTSTVWVKEITVPSAPRNLTATPGNGRVTLNWTAPSSDGGSVILRYRVSRDSGATWVDASSNTSHTFTGLTNGTSYTFRVLAVNGVGNSTAASVSATPGGNKSWTPPSSTNRFNDVPNNNWQNAAVSWADSNGITTGSPAGSSTFKPNDTITRAEFVTFLHRIYGSPSAPRATFSDMPGNPAFQNAISWAYKEKITTGSPAGSNTFLPNDNITREQIAAMLYRYVGGGNPAPADRLSNYTDQSSISTWLGARDAVNWAVHYGIMGVNTTTLNPRGNATRAEAVTMLYRVVGIFNIPAP